MLRQCIEEAEFQGGGEDWVGDQKILPGSGDSKRALCARGTAKGGGGAHPRNAALTDSLLRQAFSLPPPRIGEGPSLTLPHPPAFLNTAIGIVRRHGPAPVGKGKPAMLQILGV